MSNEYALMLQEMSELRAENERLRKQLLETRAQRAEYLDELCKYYPPPNLPSEEEMIEQIKNKRTIPVDVFLRELDEKLAAHGQ
jgi:hypothetical protein